MKILFYLAVLQSLIPLLYYWYSKKNLIVNDIKPILPFVYLCFIAGLYELIFTFILYISSTVWFYVYDFFAFFTIQYFFYFILDKKIRRTVLISSILYVLLFFYAVVNHSFEKYMDFIAYLGVFTTLLIIFYSIKWFKKTFMETEFVSLTQSPNFYFVSGFMLYYAGTIVLFLMANTIYFNHRAYISHYWLINIFFNIFHKSLLIVGILKLLKLQKNLTN